MGGKRDASPSEKFQYTKENTIDTQRIIEAKIVLLGDSGVGKSSIAQRYCKNSFNENYDVTIGGAYMQQTLNIENTVVKLHIWDTGGSDRFRSLVSMYYRDAVAAIICYDLTNERTFQSVSYWANEMQEKANQDKFVISIVGNKSDTEKEEWQITDEMVEDFKTKQNLAEDTILEKTSAKTGEGVRELFYKIAKQIVAQSAE